MIDAYEIGIRIALDDGISAGIAAMTRELRALNRAADTSLADLARLRQAAVAVASPPPAREPTRPSVVSAAEQEADETAPVTRADPGERFDPAPAAIAPQPALPAPTVSAPSSVPAETTVERVVSPASVAPVPEPERSLRVIQPERIVLEPTPIISRMAEPGAPEPIRPVPIRVDTPTAPVLGTAPKLPQTPNARRRDSVVSALRPARQAAPPVTQQTNVDVSISAQIAESPPPDRSAPPGPASQTLLSPATESPPATSPPAPLPVQPASAPRALPVQPRPTAAPADRAPDRDAAAPRTESVHVYIDGALIGRWMADHLSRSASRPPASATGFDPRVGPTWPGAPTGG